MSPNPFTLKHRPVFLLPYEPHDGPFADGTDCKYLSVGWAQYDPLPGQPRQASIKTLRHTGGKWSRQSEEMPIHRAIDGVLLLAHAVRTPRGPLELPAGTLENQRETITLEALNISSEGEKRAFEAQIRNELVRHRLAATLSALEQLRAEGLI